MTQSSAQLSPEHPSNPTGLKQESTADNQGGPGVSDEPIQEPEFSGPMELLERVQTARGWARDHLVAVVALGITLLAAGGYSVHRSWLIGWYNAAKVPSFAHSWAVQDLVMLGVVNLDIWAKGLFALTFLLMTVYWLFAVMPWMERGIACLVDKKFSKRKQPQRAQSKFQRAAIWFVQHVLVCAWFAMCALLLFLLITLAVRLLASNPQKGGYAAFQRLQIQAETSFSERRNVKDLEAKVVAIARLRKSYSHVALKVGSTDSREPTACGWLVLQNGEHVLLLTRDGPTFISASGLGFVWKSVDVGSC